MKKVDKNKIYCSPSRRKD